jgi:hypothetical protein
MQAEVYAYFGFICTGSSDGGRGRFISTTISPTYAAQILQLQEAGVTEEDLHRWPLWCSTWCLSCGTGARRQ